MPPQRISSHDGFDIEAIHQTVRGMLKVSCLTVSLMLIGIAVVRRITVGCGLGGPVHSLPLDQYANVTYGGSKE